MGYSYTIQDSGGSPLGLHQLKVFVYADDNDDEDLCEDVVIPGLIDAFEQAYNSSSQIDYWEVSYATENPSEWVPSVEDKYDALIDFRDELRAQESVPTGCHLLVESDASGGGLADGGDLCHSEDTDGDGQGDQPESSGWFDWSPAVMDGTGSDDNLKNTAIQEVFHNFIDNCLSGVDDMLYDGNEHELGQVYSNWWNDTVSPMMSGYVNGHQEHGDCQSGAWWDNDYTQTLTGCTKDALDETATEHYFN